MASAQDFHDSFGTQEIKRAAISASSSGDNTLVAAVTATKIRVHNVILMSAGTVTVTFQSGAGGTNLSGALPLVANTGFAPGFDPLGHFETAAGSLLNVSLSGPVAVTGWLTYSEIAAAR